MKKNLFLALLLLLLLLTMFNNFEHSAQVYHALIKGSSHNAFYEWLESYSVVVTFDLLVVALIIAGKERASSIVAWIILLVNLLFFDVIGKSYNVYSHREIANELIPAVNALAGTLIFSGVFAWSIHKLPLLFKDALGAEDYKKLYNESQESLLAAQTDLEEKNQMVSEYLFVHKPLAGKLKADLNSYKELFTCPKCTEYYANPLTLGLESAQKALRAHTVRCQPKGLEALVDHLQN